MNYRHNRQTLTPLLNLKIALTLSLVSTSIQRCIVMLCYAHLEYRHCDKLLFITSIICFNFKRVDLSCEFNKELYLW